DACTRGQAGPIRDCGFVQQTGLKSCTTGSTVNLTCTASNAGSQVVRICEKSGQLGAGVACTYRDSKANVIVGTSPSPVSFACPSDRRKLLTNARQPNSTGFPPRYPDSDFRFPRSASSRNRTPERGLRSADTGARTPERGYRSPISERGYRSADTGAP